MDLNIHADTSPTTATTTGCILDLPTELLSIIVTYLPRSALVQFLKTCTKLHDLAMPAIYNDVSVTGPVSRLFFNTIIQSEKDHGNHTKSLSFIGIHNVDVYSTFSLFSIAFTRMDQIQTLNITISPTRSSFLFYNLRMAFSDAKPSSDKMAARMTPGVDSICLHLPHLHMLSFHGDSKLVRFATGNNVAILFTSVWMSSNQLDFFLSSITNASGTNESLQELHIRFDDRLASSIAETLTSIGRALINLRIISVLTRKVDALAVSEALTFQPAIFVNLVNFRINDWASGRHNQEWMSKDKSLHIQMGHLIQAGSLRTNLNLVVFGTIHWTRVGASDLWLLEEKWDPHRAFNMISVFDFWRVIRLQCFYDDLQKNEHDQKHTYYIREQEPMKITRIEYLSNAGSEQESSSEEEDIESEGADDESSSQSMAPDTNPD